MEAELEEAQSIATASNHKFEDAQRKCKVVEGDLERVIERAEEFEGKARDLETQVREMESKVKETEAITVKNAEEEDKYETKIARLQEEFKLADTRAEFAERSVDKEGFEVSQFNTFDIRHVISKLSLKRAMLPKMAEIRPPNPWNDRCFGKIDCFTYKNRPRSTQHRSFWPSIPRVIGIRHGPASPLFAEFYLKTAKSLKQLLMVFWNPSWTRN